MLSKSKKPVLILTISVSGSAVCLFLSPNQYVAALPLHRYACSYDHRLLRITG